MFIQCVCIQSRDIITSFSLHHCSFFGTVSSAGGLRERTEQSFSVECLFSSESPFNCILPLNIYGTGDIINHSYFSSALLFVTSCD